MRSDKVRQICLSMPGATEELLWKDEHLVFKVGGKMFCILLVAGENEGMFSFKCDDEAFYELIELPGIIPTPYMARHHWVRIDPSECRLGVSRIEKLLRRSHELVVSKLPRKTQKALQVT